MVTSNVLKLHSEFFNDIVEGFKTMGYCDITELKISRLFIYHEKLKILWCISSENGHTHFANFTANTARSSQFTWPFLGIRHWKVTVLSINILWYHTSPKEVLKLSIFWLKTFWQSSPLKMWRRCIFATQLHLNIMATYAPSNLTKIGVNRINLTCIGFIPR